MALHSFSTIGVFTSVLCHRKLVVDWVLSSDIEDPAAKETPDAYEAAWKLLKGADGVLVLGGFGDRGVQGKILAAKYARENHVPFLGICLGMQVAVIEFARSILDLHDANSTEFDPEIRNPCVIFMAEVPRLIWGLQCDLDQEGHTSMLKTANMQSCMAVSNYVAERHRHRYEVNPDFVSKLESDGPSFFGKDEIGRRMEILELPTHQFYVGVQFHPEFKSRPGKPSELFS